MAPLPTSEFLHLQLKLKRLWQRRSLGQHFLFDEEILGRVAELTRAGERTLAIEIGPGAGTLTAQLAAQAGQIVAVEFDPRLQPIHEDAFGSFEQIEFVYADALRLDLAALAREKAAPGIEDFVLTGNIPYQITSPLLFGECGHDRPWRRMVFMVQKEVADRIASPPGRKAYGILTVKLAYWWEVVERFEVSARHFHPRPKVDSAVLALSPRPAETLPSADEWMGLSAFVDAAFGQRRKKLVNSLAGRWGAFPGKQAAETVLKTMDLPVDIRAEALSPSQLRELHRRLGEVGAEP